MESSIRVGLAAALLTAAPAAGGQSEKSKRGGNGALTVHLCQANNNSAYAFVQAEQEDNPCRMTRSRVGSAAMSQVALAACGARSGVARGSGGCVGEDGVEAAHDVLHG
jgi:hypothetical protein